MLSEIDPPPDHGLILIIIIEETILFQIDARFVWNNVIVGVIGRSHYTSWKDLEYALQLFTPIEGYNKASLIAKLMLVGKIDFEASLNVAEKKVMQCMNDAPCSVQYLERNSYIL